MREPVFTNQYKKDLEKIKKRGWNMDELKVLVVKLLGEDTLDRKYKDHPLTGNWAGRRDAHINSDWILIYKIQDQYVIFERTGSHSDLF